MKVSKSLFVSCAVKFTKAIALSAAVGFFALMAAASASTGLAATGLEKPAESQAIHERSARPAAPTMFAFQAFGAGSLIIPMDTSSNGQDNGMLRAYGLVYELLRRGVPVNWVINPAKTANGDDFSLSGINVAEDVRTNSMISLRSYRGGPFVIDAADAAAAMPVINTWQAAAGDQTAVHRITFGSIAADAARRLVAAPRIAILKDGNEFIAFTNLNAAGIRDSQGSLWSASSPDLLTEADVAGPSTANHNDGILFHQPSGLPRYSYLVAMHYSVTTAQTPEVVKEIRSWLGSSPLTHAFMQCEATRQVENSGLFLTTAGIIDDGNAATTATNRVPSDPLTQIDGNFEADAGQVDSIGLTPGPGSTFKTGVTSLINESSAPLTGRITMLTGRMDGINSNGRVTYLAGHDYSTQLPVSNPLNAQTNGVRLMLNTIFGTDAATTAPADTLTITQTAPAYVNTSTVPTTITYTATGSRPAENITITVVIPAGTTYVAGSATVPPTSITGNVLTWNTAPLAAGTSASIIYSVNAATDGSYTSSAKADYSTLTVATASSNAVTTIRDTNPPVVYMLATNPYQFNTTHPSFVFAVNPDPSPVTTGCRIDAGPYDPCTSPFTAPLALVDGNHIFYVIATDAAGNTGSAVFGFKIDTHNDAPVLNTPGFVAIPDVSYRSGPPVGAVGNLISTLVDLNIPSGGLDNVTDPDPGAVTGIAVTNCDTIKGTCFYSTDNGTTWLEVGDVTTSSRLLAADANTRIFFKPNAAVLGTVPSAFTFRAWDRTTGTNGGTADTTVNGGSTAFSTATANAVTVISGTTLISITVTPDNVTIAPGATLQLTATGTFSNGSTQNLTNLSTWVAANAQNVGVSDSPGSKGLALAAQTTVCCTPVLARLDGMAGIARFAVGIAPVITSANAKTFALGTAGSFTVTTTGTYTAVITKTGALPAGLTFVDNGNGTATISGTPTTTGTFPLTLTANSNMPPNAVQSFTLTVTTPPLVSFTITPVNTTIFVNGTRQFTAFGSFADGSTQDLTNVAAWTVTNPVVAQISNATGSQGLATGRTVGTTQIRATYNGAAATAQLTVTNSLQPTTTVITCPTSVAYAGTARTPCTATVTGTGLSQSVSVTYTNNVKASTATANAAFAGTSSYAASTATPKTFAITKVNPTCTITGYSLNFDGLPHTAAGSCKGILNETLAGLSLTATTHTNPGSYTDAWAFADVTGNYNPKSGTVADVIGNLRSSKLAIRSEINAAIATATNNSDKAALKDAVKKLDKALDDDLWRPDGNHVDCDHGNKVFGRTKAAVKVLMGVIANNGASNISDATIQRWINVLVAIDRRLAQIAIAETNVSPQFRAQAQEQLTAGDEDAAECDFDEAITHYKRAWKKVRSCNGDDDDEDDDDHCGHHDH